jgi:hypothetical protein
MPPGWASLGGVEVVMAADERNQGAKDRVKEGMSEAGKHPTAPSEGAKPGGTGGSQKSGRTDEVSEGMSEAGKRPEASSADEAERQPS